jgi:hypothetical protein
MFSTRNLSKLSACALGVLASASMVLSTGCQRIPPNRPVALNDEPLLVDEAMQIRDWDRSTSYYANGDTVAGATRLTFEPKDDTRLNYFADPLIGLTNFVIIPFTYFHTPPFTKMVYQGAIVPPTHTAVPPVEVIK